MTTRFLLLLSFAAALALPVQAQFSITVQQNGQATTVANGGTITMNAPAVGQTAVATVTLTNVGSTDINLAASPQVFGPFTYTVPPGFAYVVAPFQSATFTLNYTAASASLATGQFTWPYTQTTTIAGVTTTVGSGAVLFNLSGTSPNLTVGEITPTGSFQPVPSGGTIQFPNTALNAVASITIAISNTGSGSGTINSVTTSGNAYQLGGVPVLPITLNSGTQFNFTVQFQPTSTGNSPGSLQIAFANGTYTATLAGTGVTSLLSYTVTEGGITSPVTPGQTITLNNTQVGSTSSATVQFQNVGTSAVTLGAGSIAISGTGFSITNPPFLPLTLQPGQSDSLTVVYTPTQPGPSVGRLQIGSDGFALSASALGFTYSYQENGSTVLVNSGGTVSFPAAAEGQTTSVQFSITNAGSSPASINSISLGSTNNVFTLANLPALPLQLNSGAVTTFTINFSPLTLGTVTSTLLINNQGFNLSGFSSAPPALPAYQFTGASGTQQPFQQPAIGLSLASPYPIALAGTLTISTTSSSFAPDPAVQFSSGGTKVAFTIPANTLQAIFPNGATQIQIQTGTVAGTIQITPDFTVAVAGGTDITPANPVILQLTVPAQAPTLTTASLSAQTLTGFSISVTGYTTTRSLQGMTFQLTPASGSNLSATTFTVDVSGASAIFFPSAASQSVGGQFVVTVPFALTQSGATNTTNLSNSISAVSVKATNAAGTSNILQVSIP